MVTQVHVTKAMVFQVVMYSCESWAIEKAECQRNDAFKLWWCRRLLRIPWKARRANQSILKETWNTHWNAWCWNWSSNCLATWCEHLTHWKRPWCWERLKSEGEEGNRGWNGWMASLRQWTWTWANLGDGEGQGSLVCCSSWDCKELDMSWWLNKNNDDE